MGGTLTSRFGGKRPSKIEKPLRKNALQTFCLRGGVRALDLHPEGRLLRPTINLASKYKPEKSSPAERG